MGWVVSAVNVLPTGVRVENTLLLGGSLAKYCRLGRAGMPAPMVKVNLILAFTWPSDNTVFCLGLKTDVCPRSLALI